MRFFSYDVLHCCGSAKRSFLHLLMQCLCALNNWRCWKIRERKRKRACLFAIVDIASFSCSLLVIPCSPNPSMVLLPKLIDKNKEVQPFVVIYSKKTSKTWMGMKLSLSRNLDYKITMGRTMGCDGKLNMVHCKVSSEIDKGEKLLMPKFNSL